MDLGADFDHDAKPSDVKTTLVNIPQLETLRRVADEHERDISDSRVREDLRSRKNAEIHADIYDKLEKLQLQLNERTRIEIAMNERMKKNEERFHRLESALEDVVKIRTMEDRLRHLENQMNLHAPSKIMEHEQIMSTLQRMVNESDKKVSEAVSNMNKQFSAISSAQARISDSLNGLRTQMNTLDRKKLDRSEIQDFMNDITLKQKDFKAQMNVFQDSLDEVSRGLVFLTEQFKGELESQRKKLEADLNNLNISVTNTQEQCEKLRTKLLSLEALQETVVAIEKQLENWNLERNRLNEKVDTVIQRRLRELGIQVQGMEEKKMDKRSMEEQLRKYQAGAVKPEAFDALSQQFHEIEVKLGDIHVQVVNDYDTWKDFSVQTNKQIESLDLTVNQHQSDIEALVQKTSTTVPTSNKNNNDLKNQAWHDELSIRIGDIEEKLTLLTQIDANYHLLQDSLKSHADRLADLDGKTSAVAAAKLITVTAPPPTTTGQEVVSSEKAQELMREVAELTRRVESVEGTKVSRESMKEKLRSVVDALTKEIDKRCDLLAKSLGLSMTDMRNLYDDQIGEIQQWIMNFLRYTIEANQATAEEQKGNAYSDLPAIGVKCLVCKRAPNPTQMIDYTSETFAFRPTLPPTQPGRVLTPSNNHDVHGIPSDVPHSSGHSPQQRIPSYQEQQLQKQQQMGAGLSHVRHMADNIIEHNTTNPTPNPNNNNNINNTNFAAHHQYGHQIPAQGQVPGRSNSPPQQYSNSYNHNHNAPLRGSYNFGTPTQKMQQQQQQYGGYPQQERKKRPGSAPSHMRGGREAATTTSSSAAGRNSTTFHF